MDRHSASGGRASHNVGFTSWDRCGGAQGPVSVHYRLNGGPERALSVGPDGLRLRGHGDFNAEIPCADLCRSAICQRLEEK